MRILPFAIAVVSLVTASPAFAQEGFVIKWDRVEPVVGAGAIASLEMGPLAETGEYIRPSTMWRTAGKGWAKLNLTSGALAFRLEQLSGAYVAADRGIPIGGPIALPVLKGTVVCHSIRPGEVVLVDTPPIEFVDGTGSFEGFVALPWQCTDSPDEIAFLLRHDVPERPGVHNRYVAYGAGRTINAP